jgi:hypothetical protein
LETRQLASADVAAAYDPSGFVLFVRDGFLLAQSLDQKRDKLTGDPVQVASQVGTSTVDYASFSASDNGLLAYAGSNPQIGQLIWHRP